MYGLTPPPDQETDLVYCGVRYYNAATGRFVSRDPTGEDAGANLLAFVFNSPIGSYDLHGTTAGTLLDTDSAMSTGEAIEGEGAGQAVGLLKKVREAVDSFNNVQQFAADLLDSSKGDDTGLYVDLLSTAAGCLTGGLGKIGKSGSAFASGREFNKHHMFPQEFREDFEVAGIKIDRWLVRLEKNTHIGVHQGGWNADWDAFLQAEPGVTRKASEMFDFAVEVMKRYGCNASMLH
jgi:RHS repeat-associated protein